MVKAQIEIELLFTVRLVREGGGRELPCPNLDARPTFLQETIAQHDYVHILRILSSPRLVLSPDLPYLLYPSVKNSALFLSHFAAALKTATAGFVSYVVMFCLIT